MTKVQITLFGKQALVDADQVSLLLKKEKLMTEARELQSQMKGYDTPMSVDVAMNAVMGKIQSLNRKIRQNVQFL